MEKEKKQNNKKVENSCKDSECPFHGKLKSRGRTFEGSIVAIFDRRVTLVSERVKYVPKYERYIKARTKIHARLPFCMKDSVKKGDTVIVRECRPLSKIIHFVVIKKHESSGS